MAEKKNNKKIIFYYFKGYLSIDKSIYLRIEREYNALKILTNKKSLKKITPAQNLLLQNVAEINRRYEIYQKFKEVKWEAFHFFKCILDNDIDTNIDTSEFVAEIEPNTLSIEGDIVSFQVSKLRDNLLPAKKKKGENKIDIDLNDDEYIGEFVSVLYDSSKNIFMIQSNKYGLSFGQLSKYFTLLRQKVILDYPNYFASSDFEYTEELIVDLQPLVGKADVENIKKSKQIKKLRVRASNSVLDDFTVKKGNTLGSIRKCWSNKENDDRMVVDITFSINREIKEKTLDKTLVSDVLDNINIFANRKDDLFSLVEISRKEDDESQTELINVLLPKMSDKVAIKLKPRTSVDHKTLLPEMKVIYEGRKKPL